MARLARPALSAVLVGALAAGGALALFGVANAFAVCIPL
jgi:hypothetical protein